MWFGGLSKHCTVAAKPNSPGGLTIANTLQPLPPSLLGRERKRSRLSPPFKNPPPVAESPPSQKTVVPKTVGEVMTLPELLTTGPKRS